MADTPTSARASAADLADLAALTDHLARAVQAALATAATPAQHRAYTEAWRHVQGLARALERAALATAR